MPKVLDNLGYSPIEIGIIFAIHPLMRFFTPFLFLKKLVLSKQLFILSIILTIILIAFFYLSITNFFLFFINNLLLGITFSLILPYVEPIAISHLKKEKYGKIRIFGSLGFIFSILIIGNYLNIDYAIDLLLVSMIITLIFSIGIVNNECKVDLQDIDSNHKFSLSRDYLFWISLFLMQVSFGGYYNFFTIYEISNGLSVESVSYLWSFAVVCEIIMLYFQATLLKKIDYLLIIKFTILVTAFRWLLVFLFPQNIFLLYISQSIHAFSFALYHTTSILYLFSIYKNKKLSQQFFLGIAYGLGGFIGAIFAGNFYGEYLFLFSCIVSLLSFFVLMIRPKLTNN